MHYCSSVNRRGFTLASAFYFQIAAAIAGVIGAMSDLVTDCPFKPVHFNKVKIPSDFIPSNVTLIKWDAFFPFIHQ